MPFGDPILADVVLMRNAIQSANFATGVSGWRIKQDGTAEFSGAVIRGTLVADSLRTSEDTTEDRIVIIPSVGANQIIFPAANQSETDFRAAVISGDSSVIAGANDLFLGGGIKAGVLNRCYLYLHANDDSAGSGQAHIQAVHGGVKLKALFGQLEVLDNQIVFSDGGSGPIELLNDTNKVVDSRMVKIYEGNASATLAFAAAAADIPGATVTFTTLYANAVVLVTGTIDAICSVVVAGSVGVGELVVDGGAPNAKLIITNGAHLNRMTNSQTWRVVLAAAGSHTLKLRGRKTLAPTITSQAIHTDIMCEVHDFQ